MKMLAGMCWIICTGICQWLGVGIVTMKDSQVCSWYYLKGYDDWLTLTRWKFNKDKCQVMFVGPKRKKSTHKYRVEEITWESLKGLSCPQAQWLSVMRPLKKLMYYQAALIRNAKFTVRKVRSGSQRPWQEDWSKLSVFQRADTRVKPHPKRPWESLSN